MGVFFSCLEIYVDSLPKSRECGCPWHIWEYYDLLRYLLLLDGNIDQSSREQGMIVFWLFLFILVVAGLCVLWT